MKSNLHQKYIDRHGEELGNIRYQQYCDNRKGKCPAKALKGDKNPFFGKTMKEVYQRKYPENWEEKLKEHNFNKTKHMKNRKLPWSLEGNKNPMYGKTVYGQWLKKYGKEEADRRRESMSQKLSASRKGHRNSMYGRSPGDSAGKGYSGRYKQFYFRSLHELAFIVKVLEKYKLNWESGEISKWRIKYTDYNGIQRTYAPDFIFNSYMVEIKPRRIRNLRNLQYKQIAAQKFCEIHSMKYRIFSPSLLSYREVSELKGLKLNPRSQEKLNKQLELANAA